MRRRPHGSGLTAAALLLLVGCAHAYLPPQLPEDETARVRFETGTTAFSDVEFFSTFHIDAHDYGPNECPGRWTNSGTYLGRIDMEREGDTAEIRVPTRTRIFFSASYGSSTLGGSISCNLTYGFVPIAGHAYLARHSGNRRGCEVVVHDVTDGMPIELMGRDACPESV